MSSLRPAEYFGNVLLSVQASSHHECSPQVDGFPIEQYATVEVAIRRRCCGTFMLPSELGYQLLKFDRYFCVYGRIAGYFPQQKVAELRRALQQWAVGKRE